MEKAIKIAIENGYVTEMWKDLSTGISYPEKTNEAVLLDPLFWQALLQGLAKKNGGIMVERKGATFAQHDFIDHLAEGKDIESFFTNLYTLTT